METRLDFDHIPPGASGRPAITVEPHEFRRQGWRWWICRHCVLSRDAHPVMVWSPARSVHDHRRYM